MFFQQDDGIRQRYLPLPGFPRLCVFLSGDCLDVARMDMNNEDGYPLTIGQIATSDQGKLPCSKKLGWIIQEEFRGFGVMKVALELYLKHVTRDSDGFEVQIAKSNVASLRLAKSAGFEIYSEDPDYVFLVRR